jgi:hypothetical protein
LSRRRETLDGEGGYTLWGKLVPAERSLAEGALPTASSITAGISLGTTAGQAMLAARADDGAYAANLQTLTPYVPPNEGNEGVYVPPSGRPAMTPT